MTPSTPPPAGGRDGYGDLLLDLLRPGGYAGCSSTRRPPRRRWPGRRRRPQDLRTRAAAAAEEPVARPAGEPPPLRRRGLSTRTVRAPDRARAKTPRARLLTASRRPAPPPAVSGPRVQGWWRPVFEEAAAVILEDNPLPAILGRACTCLRGAVRTHYDEPLAIRDIKRFATTGSPEPPTPAPAAPSPGGGGRRGRAALPGLEPSRLLRGHAGGASQTGGWCGTSVPVDPAAVGRPRPGRRLGVELGSAESAATSLDA
jgi:hypothetical protein